MQRARMGYRSACQADEARAYWPGGKGPIDAGGGTQCDRGDVGRGDANRDTTTLACAARPQPQLPPRPVIPVVALLAHRPTRPAGLLRSPTTVPLPHSAPGPAPPGTPAPDALGTPRPDPCPADGAQPGPHGAAGGSCRGAVGRRGGGPGGGDAVRLHCLRVRPVAAGCVGQGTARMLAGALGGRTGRTASAWRAVGGFEGAFLQP